MKKMFVLLSHTLSDTQIAEARTKFGVLEFVKLPANLQEAFSSVPPDLDDLSDFARPFMEFLSQNAGNGDLAVIQGDFGLTYILVGFCKKNGIKALYATTKRVVSERNKNGKISKISTFEHINFREYKC